MHPADPHDRFAELYEPVAPVLRAWAVLRCRGPLGSAIEAEDLVQETCVEAYRSLASFDAERAPFRAWILGVATRLASSALRRAARRDAAAHFRGWDEVSQEPADRATTISRRVRRDEALQRFLELAEELPEDDRSLLIHRGLEGLPHTEVAALLGVAPDVASKRWQRLRAKLEAWPAARALLPDP